MPRPKTISRDGTTIAFEHTGQGPALVFVDGALCCRASGPSKAFAETLADRFTVFTYDRRGRGESTDTGPYAVEREIEDLEAVIRAAGGHAFVIGVSSGAALALDAAAHGAPITKLALYEAPFIVDDSRDPIPTGFLARLEAAVASGRRGEAVTMFMKLVGVPAIFILMMRLMSSWRQLTTIAHTLPYDITIVQDNQRGTPLPAGRWAGATMPVLVMDGGKSPAWMRNANRAIASALPTATYCTLDGQTHMVNAKAMRASVVEFFDGSAAREGFSPRTTPAAPAR